MNIRLLWLSLLALVLSACQQPPRSGATASDPLPDKLSAWDLFQRKGHLLVPGADVVAYDLNSALFSDYAHKLRTVSVPAGTAIRYGEDEFDFPVGTVISKTFYYPRPDASQPGDDSLVGKVTGHSQPESLDLRGVRLLETRLLIYTASGWVAAPYVWNAAQTEATLELAGESFALQLVSSEGREAFEYMVPDVNQCAGCHAVEHQPQTLKPIGVKAGQLNRNYRYAGATENQLDHWQKTGLLIGAPQSGKAPRNAQWDVVASGDLNTRARAYLDVNCGHCHGARAAANTSGLLLDAHETDPGNLGICKVPVASGRGSGSGSFDIVPGAPDESILLHRMESTEPDVAMPELGRSVVHLEGVALIREWIASLSGDCS